MNDPQKLIFMVWKQCLCFCRGITPCCNRSSRVFQCLRMATRKKPSTAMPRFGFLQAVGRGRHSRLGCKAPVRLLSTSPSQSSGLVAGDMGSWDPLAPPHFVDVTPLATTIRHHVRIYSMCHPLKLVGILADIGPFRQDAELYSERIDASLKEDHINYELWRCKADSPVNVEETIKKANDAEDVDGILVFYPIFPPTQKGPYKTRFNGVYYKTHDSRLRELVDHRKDVEGLRGAQWYRNLRRRLSVNTSLSYVHPCTALSVQKILEHYHDWGNESTPRWDGETVSIVNRSEIFGRPLAAMLADQGATVYSIDNARVLKFWPHGQRVQLCKVSLEECIAASSILVTGVPDDRFKIPTDYIASGTTLVNVSEFANFDENDLRARADITYIPQVGKVTVAILEENLVRLHRRKRVPGDAE